MKQRPILFSTEMVRAILEGRKTQTRRVIKPQPTNFLIKKGTSLGSSETLREAFQKPVPYDGENEIVCPYGKRGDVLWVRETWGIHYFGSLRPWHFKANLKIKLEDIAYKERDEGNYTFNGNTAYFLLDKKWKPSIHMPKAASRIWLEIVNVRVEKLHDISEDDACKEGVEFGQTYPVSKSYHGFKDYLTRVFNLGSSTESFKSLWQSIHEGSWNTDWSLNPWVWVVEFKVIEKPI